MKVQPSQCLVSEDRVPGVTGGPAPAGITVLVSRRQPLSHRAMPRCWRAPVPP